MKPKYYQLMWKGGLVAAAVLFLVVDVRSQYRRMKDLRLQISQAEQMLAVEDETRLAMARLQQEIHGLLDQASDLHGMIPAEEGLGPFLQQLAMSAEKRRLATEEIEPGEPVRSEELVALPIAISVAGRMPDLFDMIRDIEHMPRLTKFDRVSAEMDMDEPGKVEAEIHLRIFFRTSS